jgi:hypothetical protein
MSEISVSLSMDRVVHETLYKIGIPAYDPEPDWSVTLSKSEFPWSAVKFGDFSTAECYLKYKSLIADEVMFIKLVRGETFKKVAQQSVTVKKVKP